METKIINKKLKAAIYIRVSTDEKVSKGISTKAQEEEILKFIENNNEYIIDKSKHIYIDNGFSGGNDDRPALKKMMEGVKNKEFNTLFVWKIDRFFRNNALLMQYLEILTNHGIEFRSIIENITPNNPFNRFLFGLSGAMAEFEKDTIRDRTMLGRAKKAKEGFYVGGGIPKLGYSVENVTGGKKLIVNKDEKRIIERIFDLFVNEGKTVNEISTIFTNEKIPTKYDKEMINKDTYKKQLTGFWHPTTISRIIQNPMLIGKYYYGRYGIRKDESGKKVNYEKNESDWLHLPCPRILKDDDLFYKAQELIEKNKLNKNNPVNHHFAGLIKCGECGKSYVGYKTSKNTINYRCGYSLKGRSSDGIKCKNEQISEIMIMNSVWNKINALFNNPKEILEAYYKEDCSNNYLIKNLLKEDKEIKINLTNIEKGVEQIYSEYYLSTESKQKFLSITLENYENKVKILKEREQEINKRIENFNMVKANKDNIENLIKNYKIIFKDISDINKINLIKSIVSRIEVNNKNINVTYKFSIKEKGKKNKKTKNTEEKVIDKRKQSLNLVDAVTNYTKV